MSADNGIYILHTKDRYMKTGRGMWKTIEGGVNAWRIAHVQAIDNFDWYRTQEPHNLGHYMAEVWKNSPVFYKKEQAIRAAHKLAGEYNHLEYGVQFVEAAKFNFPGC